MTSDLDRTGFQILLLPPWENAGPEHWMSHWQRKNPAFVRVEQRDWDNPDPDQWVLQLDEYVQRQAKPVIIVSHSLGSIALAHWAHRFKRKITGAFIVAPPDLERTDTPLEIKNFAPVPLDRFDFSSLLVASENDPYASLERSRFFAGSWGSRFRNVGRAGHLNPRAGFGEWPEGEALFSGFVRELAANRLEEGKKKENLITF